MSYPGGKHGSGVYQQIINRIPPHDYYVEPFLGGGAVMKMKRPARASIGIDIDAEIFLNFPRDAAPNLTLLQEDAIQYLKGMLFFPVTFIYIDPPYLMSTRSSNRRIYNHELSEDAHMRLVYTIKALPCMVMISGYPNALYDDVLSSWWTHTFQTTNRGGGHVTEKLWMNYPAPIRLHDYRYLGSNFREREKLKRKRLRWSARLVSMPDLERHMLAAAIAEVEESGQHRPKERTAPAPLDRNNGTRSPEAAI